MDTLLYAGSFDPVTRGHMDVIRRAAALCPELVVAVMHNPEKHGFLPVPMRVELLKTACRGLNNVRVIAHGGLLIDCAHEVGAKAVIRGLRPLGDFESEYQMAQVNKRLGGVETLLMTTSDDCASISSSIVRQVAAFGGDSIGQARRVIDELEARINDARRVPMSKTLSIIDTGELIDLIGQLRIVLPHTVVQAQAILDERKKILGEAKEEAKASTGKADAYYTEKVENAKRFEQDVKMEADAYDKQIRQKAQEDSNAIIADANTRAEQIVFNAQQQAQKLVEDNEITRRAQAYAVETRERAEKDADSIYNQACVQVDKMLSGAAAALSRSASELAALRDNLLTQGNNPQQDR